MGRRLRNKLPLVPENLRPRKIDQEKLHKKEQEYRERYSDNYNTRHRAVELPTLQQGDKVFIRDQARYGEVEKKLESPRSYQLVTETGSVIRRNRRALVQYSLKNQASRRALLTNRQHMKVEKDRQDLLRLPPLPPLR